MRLALVIAVVTTSWACSSESLVPPSQVGIRGTYVLAECHWLGSTPPCVTYYSGTSQHWLDSARFVLNRDGTGAWMAAGRSSYCQVGQPCVHDTSFVDRSITYQIAADKLQILPDGSAGGFEFSARIPDRVPSDWSGPDVLQFGQDGGTTHRVTFGRVQ